MKYHWILFDLDGTLLDFDAAAVQALRNTFQQYELPFAEAYIELYFTINKGIWTLYEKGEIPADELKWRRFKVLFERLGHPVDPVRFSTDFLTALSQGSQLIDGAVELLEALNGKVKMMVITNGFSKVQRPRLLNSPIHAFFTDYVISDEVGIAKPEPGIFEVAFEKMGHPDKSTVLIVGDSLGSDMKGGTRYGIDTCWMNPKKMSLPAHQTVTYEMEALHELPALIAK